MNNYVKGPTSNYLRHDNAYPQAYSIYPTRYSAYPYTQASTKKVKPVNSYVEKLFILHKTILCEAKLFVVGQPTGLIHMSHNEDFASL